MSSPDFLNSSVGDVANVHAVSHRNAIMGVVSIINSTIVIVLLVTTTKLKQTIKITLTNLLISDIYVMVCGFIYGAFLQVHTSSDKDICAIIVFFTLNGFLSNQAAVLGISFNNFSAVFYPLKHNILVTTKSVMIGVLVMWLSIFLVSGSFIVYRFPPGLPCVVLASIPRYGSIVVFCFFLIVDFSIIVLNTSICIALRRRRQVHVNRVVTMFKSKTSSTPENKTSPKYPFRDPDQRLAEMGKSPGNAHTTTLKIGEASTSASRSISGQLVEAEEIASNMLRLPRNPRLFLAQSIAKENDATGDDFITTNKDYKSVPGETVAKDARRMDIDTLRVERSKRLPVLDCLGTPSAPMSGSKSLSPLPENTTPAAVTATPRTPPMKIHRARKSHARSVSVSMVIISLWCCIVNIPSVIYLFYIAFITTDRLAANYSLLGVLSTTLLLTNIMGDPFIYGWRFVPWRNLAMKLRQRCRRRRQSHDN